MSWRQVVASLRGRFGGRERRSDQDIDDELMFHLRESLEERLDEGHSPDAAWSEARARFGSLVSAANDCRRTASARFAHPTLLAALLASVLTLVLGWLVIEVRALRSDRLESGNDLSGTILDYRGAPIADAQVLVVLKTWPGGWFRQDAFQAVSDRHGSFRLAGLLPQSGQFAVQLSALRDGYAWQSIYQLHESGAESRFEPVTLRLEQATTITLSVRDSHGRPLPHVRLTPAARRSRQGASHLVYLQGSEPVHEISDAWGTITLRCFEQGDVGDIFLQTPRGEWERHSIAISDEATPVVVSANSDSEEVRDKPTTVEAVDRG